MIKNNIFEILYKDKPIHTAFIPYRICTLGAHIDHQLGCINGLAIDKGVNMEYSPSESEIVTIHSVDFNQSLSFCINGCNKKNNTWIDYAKSALWSLKESGFVIMKGFKAVIEGSMPIGGLSSSAAVTILYINAFCKVNNLRLDEKALIEIAHKAEREYIGLKCGKLDQSCEILCREYNLLFLDTQSGKYENISIPESSDKFEIGIFFSGIEHALVNSDYNKRTDELKSAVIKLGSAGSVGTDKNVLREIPFETFETYSHMLTDNEYRRCIHFYTENERAIKGADLFRNGNIREYGRLIIESGNSSVDNYECGSEELTRLFFILKDTPGVYGARFSGAGFKGCCFALVNPGYKEEIESSVREKYLNCFPELKEKYRCTFCLSADGFGGTK